MATKCFNIYKLFLCLIFGNTGSPMRTKAIENLNYNKCVSMGNRMGPSKIKD